MESTDSSTSSQHPQLPPGFRFHPTDEELVVHYLKKKAASIPLPVTIIADIDLYKFDPWELPSKATFGEQEWYFFSPRDRKYPNGARPNRAATSGYWKATGTDKPILTSNGNQKVGVKKALVFYGGKPPKGIKTNWIMHEYRLIDNNLNNNNSSSSSRPQIPDSSMSANKKSSLRLDDWVLCRIYKKNNPQTRPLEKEMCMENMYITLPTSSSTHRNNLNPSPASLKYGSLLDNDDDQNNHHDDDDHQGFFDGMLSSGGGGDHNNSGSTGTTNNNNSHSNTSFPMKRAMPQQQYWNITEAAGNSMGNKRFHGDLNSGGNGTMMTATTDDHENNSFVSLLNHLPQTVPFHPNSLLGTTSLGDPHSGNLRPQHQFHHHQQLPGMNWNSSS